MELQINVDGVNVVDSRTRMVIYRYPLHRISFCADDKQDKRVFSFIAKQDSNTHRCFVFLSDKLAEEITQTIGEAFDLAYRKFKETSGKDLEGKKQIVILKKKVQELEAENKSLKNMVQMYERQIGGDVTAASGIAELQRQMSAAAAANAASSAKFENWYVFKDDLVPAEKAPPPPLDSNRPPPPSIRPPPVPTGVGQPDYENTLISLSQNGPDVGRKLENLQLDGMDDIFDQYFDPRAGEPRADGRTDAFGLAPFGSSEVDGSGSPRSNDATKTNGHNMAKMDEEGSPEDLLNMISHIDSRIAEAQEMQAAFSAGLGIGTTDDVELNDFDPLNSANGSSSLTSS